jgi:hypothetical protein
VTLCAVCTVHMEMMRAGFLVEPQNQDRRFVSDLASKSLGRFSLVWPQTGGDGFLQFGLKTGGSGFLVWSLKPAAMVW